MVIFCLVSVAANAEKIKVVTEHIPPFQIAQENNQLGGYATEVVNALFTLTQDQADIHVLPWARAYNTALVEEDVLIFSIAHTKERADLFQWIGEIHFQRFYFWGLKDKFTSKATSIKSLEQYPIALTKGYNSEQYLKKFSFEKSRHVMKNSQALAMLYLERVDLILLNDLMLELLKEKSTFPNKPMIKLLEAKDLNSQLGIAFSKSTKPEIVTRFRKAFQQLESSGALDKIKARWQKHLSPSTS